MIGATGFWSGLWHGMIAPIAFVLSLLDHHTQVDEVHDNGVWHDLGFLLGGGVLSGGGASAKRGRRGAAWRPRCARDGILDVSALRAGWEDDREALGIGAGGIRDSWERGATTVHLTPEDHARRPR